MSSGANAGSKTGEGIKGAWNAFDSAGEAIRGTLNGAIDGAGKAVAGGDSNSTSSRVSTDASAAHDAAIRRDETTANSGISGVKSAIDKLSGGSRH